MKKCQPFWVCFLNKKRKKKIGALMMEKFGTFYQFSNDRINITLIWVWFSNKDLNIKNEKINFIKVILKLECLFYHTNIYVPTKHGICIIMEFFPPII